MNSWASLSRRSRCWRVVSHCVDPPSLFSLSVSPASPEPSAGPSASSWWWNGRFGSTRRVPEEKCEKDLGGGNSAWMRSKTRLTRHWLSPLTCHCPDVRAAGRPRPLLWTLECTGPYSCPSASDRPADWSTQKQAGSATDNPFLKRQAHHPKSADTQMKQTDIRDRQTNNNNNAVLSLNGFRRISEQDSEPFIIAQRTKVH